MNRIIVTQVGAEVCAGLGSGLDSGLTKRARFSQARNVHFFIERLREGFRLKGMDDPLIARRLSLASKSINPQLTQSQIRQRVNSLEGSIQRQYERFKMSQQEHKALMESVRYKAKLAECKGRPLLTSLPQLVDPKVQEIKRRLDRAKRNEGRMRLLAFASP